ncbi:hypothetical protein V8D89_008607 [Ganoderma adspersum]
MHLREGSAGNGCVGYSGLLGAASTRDRYRHIPTEVCENIIDMLYSYLARDTFQEIGTLHSCALVCRAWRVRSQRMLFFKVQLSDGPSIHRLSAILDAGPHLRGYVHEVTLIGYYLNTTAIIFAIFPAVFAGKLPNIWRVDVIHLSEHAQTTTATAWYPWTNPPYRAKPIPHIPLHPRFPTFLSSFTAVSFLALAYTVFRSLNECAWMLHGLPDLEQLQCEYVRWLARRGSHPGADIEAPRLVWTRGPHLTVLDITVPLSEDESEEPARGTFPPSTERASAKTLFLSFTPHFSMGAHARHVRALLGSWNPRLPHSACLVFRTYRDWRFTRRGFADVLRGLGTVAEPWLQTVESTPPSRVAQYQLVVNICDSEAARQLWSDHIHACFPTWLRLGRLRWNFEARE